MLPLVQPVMRIVDLAMMAKRWYLVTAVVKSNKGTECLECYLIMQNQVIEIVTKRVLKK